MAYKCLSYAGDALGAKVSTNVLCTFPISAAGAFAMRVEVVTTDNEDTAIKLQHSMDGTTWTDVATSAETTAKTHSVVVGKTVETANDNGVDAVFTDNNEGSVPLKPLGRVIANATMTVEKVLVAMDR